MRRGSSRSMQSPEARDLARALRISVWYARHAYRGIPGNEQAARACFRYLEKSYRYWGLRGRSCSLVASPGGVVPCSCASFCAPYSSTTLEGGYILTTPPSTRRHAAKLALRPIGAARLPLAYGVHQALLQQAPAIPPSGGGAWASTGRGDGGLPRDGAGGARPPPRISRRSEPAPAPSLPCRSTLQRFGDIVFG